MIDYVITSRPKPKTRIEELTELANFLETSSDEDREFYFKLKKAEHEAAKKEALKPTGNPVRDKCMKQLIETTEACAKILSDAINESFNSNSI